QKHNCAGFKHTTRYRPWKLILCLAFADEERAMDFEKYLKSGSGNAFAKKRFW
ncbi:GIY-YIG nuclease family protein, partial [Candidatus Dependentiae bacterium]